MSMMNFGEMFGEQAVQFVKGPPLNRSFMCMIIGLREKYQQND